VAGEALSSLQIICILDTSLLQIEAAGRKTPFEVKSKSDLFLTLCIETTVKIILKEPNWQEASLFSRSF